MSRLTEHIGFEVARAALAHLAPEVRAPLLRLLGPPITSLFDGLLGLLGAGEDEASQLDLLTRLLTGGGGLPPGEAFLDAELPLSAPPSEGATRLARHCGRLFGPALQGALLALAGANGAEEEEERVEGGGAEVPATPEEREKPWRETFTELGRGDLAPELKAAGAFEEVDFRQPVAAAAALFTPEKVIRMLEALVAVLGKLFPDFLDEARRMLASGLRDAAARTVIAAAVSQAAARANLAKSDLKIGNKVHRTLQDLYVTDYKANHDLVVERYNRRIGRAEAVVVGPSTKGLRRSFSYLFKNNLDRDYFFRALQLALATPKLESRSEMRADLINATRGSIWEIKPVGSAVTGVWQETMYRLSFNIVRRFLLFASKLPAHRPTTLESGSAWLGVSSAWTKFDPEAPFLFTLSPIFVTTAAGLPAVAVPFQLSMLPGLVPYLVVSVESLQKWMEAVRRLAEAARRKAVEILEKMASELRQAAEAVLEALQPVLVVLMAILLALMALMPGLRPLPGLQPGVVPGTTLPPSMRGGSVPFASVMDGVMYVPWGGKPGGRGASQRPEEAERTDINFGSVIVGNVPIKELESLFKAIRGNFDGLVTRSIVTLDRKAAELTPGVA